jgi:hypothetical protein
MCACLRSDSKAAPEYVRIRQHPPSSVGAASDAKCVCVCVCVCMWSMSSSCIRQHASAYVSIRQHTSACVSVCVCMWSISSSCFWRTGLLELHPTQRVCACVYAYVCLYKCSACFWRYDCWSCIRRDRLVPAPATPPALLVQALFAAGDRSATPADMYVCTSAYASMRQHASAYVSIRQHTSAYVRGAADLLTHPPPKHVLPLACTRHTSAYVSIRQHTSAHVRGAADLLTHPPP